jgi:hypothetical protein
MSEQSKPFFVYYRRHPEFKVNLDFHMEFSRDSEGVHMSSEYVFVGTQFAKSKDDVYARMQGDRWSPRGEARKLIKAIGLQHTSMSVGDVVVDSHGAVFEADRIGWREF